jgi:hypothetical protein
MTSSQDRKAKPNASHGLALRIIALMRGTIGYANTFLCYTAYVMGMFSLCHWGDRLLFNGDLDFAPSEPRIAVICASLSALGVLVQAVRKKM